MFPSKHHMQLPTVRSDDVEYGQFRDLMNNLRAEMESLVLTDSAVELLLQRTGCPFDDVFSDACLEAPSQVLELFQAAPATNLVHEFSDQVKPGNIPERGTTSKIEDLEHLPQLFHIITETSAIGDIDKSSETSPPRKSTSIPSASCMSDRILSPPGKAVIPFGPSLDFHSLLTTTVEIFNADFLASIKTLSIVISRTSRPASTKGKSDLYPWRAIFQLYIDAQIFESTSELDRGERPVAQCQARLDLFTQRVHTAVVSSFRIPESRAALQLFLALNNRLVSFKKFQKVNASVAHKLLAKHKKFTVAAASTLTSPCSFGEATTTITTHELVIALTETLTTVVPRIDDYLCLICFALAFKPVRLSCAHLFCVRCLVKMQKQGKGNCPLCRAPTVVLANESNVDHALINFMRDWFPRETREKTRANNRESAREEMEELGLDTRCVVT